jgi:toluene monooxygenase system protein A
MLSREEWLPLARKLDWDYTYVREDEVFPQVISGHPWLPHAEWKECEESFKTSYREYVDNQYEKDMAVYAVRDAVGRLENIQKLAAPWMNSLKVHAAALPLSGVYRRHRQSARCEVWPRQRLANHGDLWSA